MQIHINAHDGVPIYLQVVNQIKYQVAAGRSCLMCEISADMIVKDLVDFCDGKDSTTRIVEGRIDWLDSGDAEAA